MTKIIIFISILALNILSAVASSDQDLINYARIGKIDNIKLLIENGADPKARNSQALIYAAEKGHADIVELLLKNGADSKAQDSKALVEAAKYGYIEIIKLLLENDIDNKVQNPRALIEAIRRNHIKIVKLLLEHGADPKNRGSEALADAARKGRIEIAKLLLEHGADPKAQNSKALVLAGLNGNTDIIKLLLANGANASAQGSKALANAAQQGHIEAVKLLLENGSDPKARDSQALVDAGFNGHTEIIKLLLANGADPKAQDSKALANAAHQSHIEAVKLLLKSGAEPTKAIKDTIINNSDILNLFAAHYTDTNVFFLEPAVIKSFIEIGNFDKFISIYDSKTILSNTNVIKSILLSGEYNLVKYLFDNVPELKNAYLIGVGLNWNRGTTTTEILKIVSDKLKFHKNSYHIEISLEIAQDENIMQYCSGLINPGADDSYPRQEEPFVLADMGEKNRMYHEKVYQQVITMAKKYDIPYLGICAGSQHLVLNSRGSLKQGGHGSDNTKITFNAGTIPHFLLLTEQEKTEALSQCKFTNIELTDAYTMHGYAGYIENLGEDIKLAAISEEGIPESYSLGANKIGSQFHPEVKYYDTDHPGLNRHKQFLDNIFGIFEGYYSSMQYAKKMGISKEIAKAAIQKVNQELVERLEYCDEIAKVTHQVADKTSGSNSIDQNETAGTSTQKNIYLWDKSLNIEYNDNVETISVMPGLTALDIAVTRESDKDLVIYVKDGEGRLTILDRFAGADLKHPLRLAFADGSSINLDPENDYEADVSFPGEELMTI